MNALIVESKRINILLSEAGFAGTAGRKWIRRKNNKQMNRQRFNSKTRERVYAKCNGHCAYCGAEIPISKMQIDHLIPFEFAEAYAAQGIDLNAIENLMPSCRSCNNYKSSLTLEKFRQAIERWPEVLQRDNVTYRNAVRFGMIEPKPHKVTFYFELLQEETNELD